jgi:hypothetical protein
MSKNNESNVGCALSSIGILLGFLVIIGYLSSPLWAVKPAQTTELLSNLGYSDIQIKGFAWFACDKSDIWRTKFKAMNPNGVKTTGAVCSGLFKNNTIRYQ